MQENYRKVALRLHGLAKADQQWILNKIPRDRRNALRGMLRELEGIGVPKDIQVEIDDDEAELSGATLASDGQMSKNDSKDDSVKPKEPKIDQPAQFQTPTALARAIGIIDSTSAKQIWSTLENELEEVQALLLAYRPWTWRNEVLRIVKSSRRNELYEIGQNLSSTLPRRFQEAFIEVFAQRLEQTRGVV